MPRRLFTILAALSFLSGLGVLTLWIGNHANQPTYAAMSYSHREFYRPPSDTGLLVVPSGIYLMVDQRVGAPPPPLYLPYWLMTVLSFTLPSIWTLHFRRSRLIQKRIAKGRCPTCGYDLRATPDRCPECGHIPSTSSPQSTAAAEVHL